MESKAILELEDVHTYYGLSHILQGISLRVDEGEIVCLLGRNGVGKTTTLRSIMGLAPSRRGHIRFRGAALEGSPPDAVARRGIGFVPEDRRVFVNLTVEENLRMGSWGGRAKGGWTVDAVYELFPRLHDIRRRLAGYLSGGEQQMLAVGRALTGNPDLLLLDEPSQGLAPIMVKAIEDAIRRIREQHLTVLLVEQSFRLATALADRCYVISKGQIVYEATSAELQKNEEVKKGYLGV